MFRSKPCVQRSSRTLWNIPRLDTPRWDRIAEVGITCLASDMSTCFVDTLEATYSPVHTSSVFAFTLDQALETTLKLVCLA